MPSGVAGAASKRVSQSTATLSLVLRWNPLKNSYKMPQNQTVGNHRKIFAFIYCK